MPIDKSRPISKGRNVRESWLVQDGTRYRMDGSDWDEVPAIRQEEPVPPPPVIPVDGGARPSRRAEPERVVRPTQEGVHIEDGYILIVDGLNNVLIQWKPKKPTRVILERFMSALGMTTVRKQSVGTLWLKLCSYCEIVEATDEDSAMEVLEERMGDRETELDVQDSSDLSLRGDRGHADDNPDDPATEGVELLRSGDYYS